MSDCDCENCTDDDEENGQENTYTAFMMAGELAVEVEAESGEEARAGAKELWEKARDDVKNLNGDERRSVNLK